MKTIYGILAITSLLCLWVTVGITENNQITFTHFIIQSSALIICIIVFVKLAGGFDYYEDQNCIDYIGRNEYLNKLADEYGIDVSLVFQMADLLGEEENLDTLTSMIEEYLNMNIKIS